MTEPDVDLDADPDARNDDRPADGTGDSAADRTTGGGAATHTDPRRRRVVLVLVLLAAAAFAASLLVQFHVVPLHSDNRDEGVYIFQARMLREGMVTLPAERYGEFFRPWLSGETDGRIFTEYQVGFPLFLAAADLLLGSMRLALALVAAATVPAAYGFTRALFGSRRVALWAAGFVALSPIAVLHSALFVTYSLTVLLLLAAGWAVLRAIEHRSWPHALGGGLATGAALVVRPMDVVLFMVPVGALALWRLHAGGVGLRRSASLVALAIAGVVPFGLLTLWYNSATTGSPLRFPNMAADELNTFGFGERRLVETEPVIRYELRDAVRALWDNVVAVPSWLPGGAVLLALAVVGVVWGGRRRGGALDARVALVGIVIAFPVGYFFWWATALSADGAVNGIGPHYYVPAMVALCLLGARGLVLVFDGRAPVLLAGTLVVMVGLTAWALPDKWDDKRTFTRRAQNVHAALPDDLRDAVVVVDYEGRPYTMSKFPFLVNDPLLEGDVLFAADRGALNVELFDRFPDRDLYFLREELRPGDDLFVPSGSFAPLTGSLGDSVTFDVEALDLPPGRPARAFLTVDGRTEYVDLGVTGSELDSAGWTLVPAGGAGGRTDDPAEAATDTVVVGADVEVLVGVETSLDADFGVTERLWEQHSVALRDDGLVLLSPGRGRALALFGDTLARLSRDVSPNLRIEARAVG